MEKFYKLPALDYKLNELEPVISEKLLTLHYAKHHQKYVDDANILLEKLDSGRKNNDDLDMKGLLKSLSFNVGGHVLHGLFWKNMIPVDGYSEPGQVIKKAIEEEFGSMDRFKEEFNKTALTVEGSGWGALAYSKETKRLLPMQIEKHNANCYAVHKPLLVLDVWEHSYYLDYENNRQKFIEEFWKIVNWKEVEKRYKEAIS